MSDYVKVTHTDQVSVGDVVRGTVEGRVVATYEDPGADSVTMPTHNGVVLRDDKGYHHEVFPDSPSRNVNIVKLVEDPEVRPGQMWRGGDALFVTIGTDDEGFVLHDIRTGVGYRPNEFFTRYRHNYSLAQEAPA